MRISIINYIKFEECAGSINGEKTKKVKIIWFGMRNSIDILLS